MLGAGGVLGAAWTIGGAVRAGGGGGLRRRDLRRTSSARRPARCWPRCSAPGSASATCWTTSSAEPVRSGPLAGYTLRPRPRDRRVAAAAAAAADRARPRLLHASGPAPALGARRWPRCRRCCPPGAGSLWTRPAPGRRDRRPVGRVVAAPGRVDRRDGLRQRAPGRVRQAGRAGGRAGRGGARVLLDPGVVRPGDDRRSPVHRRRHLLADVARPARRAGPRRGRTCSRRCARSTYDAPASVGARVERVVPAHGDPPDGQARPARSAPAAPGSPCSGPAARTSRPSAPT